ncbi:MAG: Gfo/Idh/MocA family oxidoreductase [Phycisphaerales bacterium]|nr:MAG: Gfo/Idh/MocA family oxidoreductase [Phycisphaerales bacterium]
MSKASYWTRRRVLRGMAGTWALPYSVPAFSFGSDAPSNWVTLACIGVGGRGTQNLRSFLGHRSCRVLAVCDVNRKRAEEARRIVNEHYDNTDCTAHSDYRDLLARDDIDAVSIASPDQWHVLQSAEAARAGKDVFLEKPLGLSVKENVALREAVHRYERVFQFGTQQRSDRNFRFACELVLNGYLGELKMITVGVPASRAVHAIPPSDPPAWLDWDRWVGPARWMPYRYGIVGNCGEWGHISNFSLGWITTWGIHHVDIAQWGNGADNSGPVEVEGRGVFPENGLYDCATAWDMTLTYGNGVVMRFVDKQKQPQGVRFEGPEGWVFVKRGAIDAEPKSLLREQIKPEQRHVTVSNDHWGSFLDCVKTRQTPVSSIDAAVRTDTVCHISDIAMRLGRKLHWDPQREEFVNDAQANRMLSRAWRSPWHL